MQIRLYIAVILAGAIDFVSAQNNLVINPSFEAIYSCPNNPSQIDTAIGWGILLNGGGSTPDLYAVCCTQPYACGVPSHPGIGGFQYPHAGNNYAGIGVAHYNIPNICREYIQSKLISRLKTGDTYCVKFYVSLSNLQQAYIKTLGAYFDDGSVSAPIPYGLATGTPQVYNSSQPLNDTLNWMKIEGSFVAAGIEEYITLGNFFPDSLSGIGFFGTPSIWTSYYYIDDVSVINTNLPALAGNDTIIQPGDSVFIGRQPEVGLNEDCIWFVNGNAIDTIAGMWVKPDSTTTYILEQTICGNVKWDTVTVIVSGVGIATYTNSSKGIMIYPNPATNMLNIESSTKFSQLIVTDILGNVLIRQLVYNKAVSVDVSELSKGLYFVKMIRDKGIVVRRFLKE